MNSKSGTLSKHLSELGLTPDEVSIYSLLISRGGLSAKAISEHLGIIVNSVYRSTNALIDKGLIKALDVAPKQFQAVSPSVAIKRLAEKRIGKIKNVSESAISHLDIQKNPNRLNMDIMTGREELFESFVELAERANKEILVISIGEEVPESIWSVIKQSLDKGVETKFIFHKNNKDNVLLIKRWQAMGVPIRHIPSEGYHLNIFDHTAAILSASNTKQSHERTGVVIYNEAIIEALRTYFFQQWALARPV
ncbi:MAG: helix-turn-helix domain-containing protein [Patescibacteria group bacterium]